MNNEIIDKIVRHKLQVSSASPVDVDVIEETRKAVVDDICGRHPWTFLRRGTQTDTLAADDSSKDLSSNFLFMREVVVYASDNVIYPVHSKREIQYDQANPDTDSTGRPFLYWVEMHEDTGKPVLQFRPKSDGVYTLRSKFYQKLAENETDLIPNGLVVVNGIVAALNTGKQQITDKELYEAGIFEMWSNDALDLNDEPVFEDDPVTTSFNLYIDSIS